MKRPALKNFRRIVVKVGSSLLIDSDAGEVRSAWLAALAADIAKLHGEGRDVLVVSSGSIALGRSRLKLPRGPLKLEESQGAAAVGQIALARIWSEVLGAHGIGELGITGTAAAIANAVYHATGVRVRDLPVMCDALLTA